MQVQRRERACPTWAVHPAFRLSYGMDSQRQPMPPEGGDAAGLPRFEACWLAEAVRLRELRDGSLEDRAAVAEARAAGGTPEARVMRRAALLGAREGLADALRAWKPRARLVLVILALVALATGFGSALAVLGEGGRPVNVVWALGGLLGVHTVALLLWLASLAAGRGEGGGALGRAWLWLSARLAGASAARDLTAALGAITARTGLARWWLGAVTHGLWLAAMAGALVGLVATLAARRYGFVWETTILPADTFVGFVAAAGWLPAQLGFTVPDEALVRASGVAALSDEAARIAWSSWLAGCVTAYGLVPRLLLWAGCLLLWRVGRARVRLDLAAPGFAPLIPRLCPESERLGVVDAAPAHLHRARVARHGVADASARVVVGLELDPGAAWPPALPPGTRDAGVVDTREERRRVLAQLAAAPPGRLLVACDARRSPDRGSLGMIAELAAHAGECRVWLVHADAPAAGERLAHWYEGLAAVGIAPQQVSESEAAALRWLGAAPDGTAAGGRRP